MKPLTILIGALGGDGGGVLCDWIVAAAQSQGLGVQATQIPGVAQRTGRHHLLPGSHAGRRTDIRYLRAGAEPGDGRSRCRAGDRAAGSRPHDLQRLRDARPHHADRLDAPRTGNRRAHGDGRRQLRCRPATPRREGTQPRADPVRHGPGCRGIRRRHQRRPAGRAGRIGQAADPRTARSRSRSAMPESRSTPTLLPSPSGAAMRVASWSRPCASIASGRRRCRAPRI